MSPAGDPPVGDLGQPAVRVHARGAGERAERHGLFVPVPDGATRRGPSSARNPDVGSVVVASWYNAPRGAPGWRVVASRCCRGSSPPEARRAPSERRCAARTVRSHLARPLVVVRWELDRHSSPMSSMSRSTATAVRRVDISSTWTGSPSSTVHDVGVGCCSAAPLGNAVPAPSPVPPTASGRSVLRPIVRRGQQLAGAPRRRGRHRARVSATTRTSAVEAVEVDACGPHHHVLGDVSDTDRRRRWRLGAPDSSSTSPSTVTSAAPNAGRAPLAWFPRRAPVVKVPASISRSPARAIACRARVGRVPLSPKTIAGIRITGLRIGVCGSAVAIGVCGSADAPA